MDQTESETYYHHLCDHLGVALIGTDTNLKVQVWNAEASRMFGASAAQVIGESVISVFWRENRDAVDALLQRAIQAADVSSLEFSDRDLHGDRRELAAVFAPVVADNGDRVGVSICIRDVTQRIRLQRELHEGRRMQALGELAGAVAHHFNNILGGIITSVDYAVDSGDSSTMRRVLKQTGQASLRACRLVNGLLTFSEGDQRADDLSDFSEIIFSIVDDLEEETSNGDIDLKINIARLPVMPTPRTQVTTILRNICRNAVEAMPNGGTLGIGVTLEPEAIITEITDTGPGLDEEACLRIFEPFWSTKTRSSNTPTAVVGLGLAIAHGVAQVLGGSIQVASVPGEGCRFRITIPRSPSP